MSRRPSLAGLTDSLSGFVDNLITPAQLRGLGWATGGGAAGTIALHYARPLVAKVPFIDKLPAEVPDALVGAVAGRLAWGWNSDFAKGLVGATTGRAAAKFVLRMVMPDVVLADAGDDIMLSQAESDQIAPPSDALRLDPATFSEAEVDPFAGLETSAEQLTPLGAWVS